MLVNVEFDANNKIQAKVLLSNISFITKGAVAGGDMPFYVHTLSGDLFVTNDELFVNRHFVKINVVDVIGKPDVLASLSKPDVAIYINPDAIEFCGVTSSFKSQKDRAQLVKIIIKPFEFICGVDADMFFSALSRASEGEMYFVKSSSHGVDGIIDNNERNVIVSGSNILTIQPYDANTSRLTMKNGMRLIVEKTTESF